MNLKANWTAPDTISALTTARIGGFSQAPYDTNNLAFHVDDNPEHVKANREALIETLKLPAMPDWLEQTHSTDCVIVEAEANRCADAAITRSPEHVLAIMTADCLPIVLCNAQGTEIAAIHAGWRGLVNGIITNTLAKMHSTPSDQIAWIGPAICQKCYEVGDEVLDTFAAHYSFAGEYFRPREKKWLADLAALAGRILHENGIKEVYQSNMCTFENESDFYSYRRASQTGRIATLIWFNNRKQD